MTTQSYADGKQAYLDGKSFVCPHHEHAADDVEWIKGWLDAADFDDMCKELGENV